MKRLKANQTDSCTFCKEFGTKTRAVWSSNGFYEAACQDHVAKLSEVERSREVSHRRNTDADHQTWGAL